MLKGLCLSEYLSVYGLLSSKVGRNFADLGIVSLVSLSLSSLLYLATEIENCTIMLAIIAVIAVIIWDNCRGKKMRMDIFCKPELRKA